MVTKKMGKCKHPKDDVFRGKLKNQDYYNVYLPVKICYQCGTILEVGKKYELIKCNVEPDSEETLESKSKLKEALVDELIEACISEKHSPRNVAKNTLINLGQMGLRTPEEFATIIMNSISSHIVFKEK